MTVTVHAGRRQNTFAGVRLIFKMKRFNQRKAEILKFIDRMGEATALDVARGIDITQINASRLLGHYFRQGLLERHTINKFGEKRYEITDRGRERLRWILGGSPR